MSSKPSRYVSALSVGLIFTALSVGTLHAQAITSFAEVAGKWTGTSSRGSKTEIEIDQSGKFKLQTPAGKDAGTARLDGGVLILPISDNQGQYKFSKKAETLDGSVQWRGIDATVVLTRAK